YLLTFIIAFEREALYSRTLFSLLLIVAVAGVTRVVLSGPHTPLGLQILAYGGALLAGCMVCHGELYRLRPAPRHLSAFYLWVSVGGVLGGLIVTLVAPRLFVSFAEYPLALAACCLISLVTMLPRPPGEEPLERLRRMMRMFLLAFVIVGLGVAVADFRSEVRLTARNFFGVVQVLEQARGRAAEHRFTLKHGAIAHGVQYTEAARRRLPMSYFTLESGLGLAITEHRRLREAVGLPPGLRIGVLGLGIGSTAALAQAEDSVRFYEINPKIISLARGEGGYFSYLADSPARVEVVEGDARISLERELERGEPQGFDVLAVDTFSSDSIPVHLLTEEAVAVYRQHLAPHGVLALHISNAHLDMVPVALAHAKAFGMHATLVVYDPKDNEARSIWMLLGPDAEFSWGPTFARAPSKVRRLELMGAPAVTWTDERGSVLPLLRHGSWHGETREIILPSRARP
ncbi:MAG: fused MFS/spermidine synthase, partial [Myxococcaceae bacterium]|nr:fused MFS/spermidine synthase [Myxococcaceae bacterium]